MRKVTETIHAGLEDVWRHLTVPELMGGWMRGVQNLRTAHGSVIEQGTILLFEARGKTRQSRVDTCIPLQTLVLTSTQGSFTATYRYDLTGDSRGTRLSLSINCSAAGPMRIAAPLISLLAWLSDKSHPSLLKQAVEA